MHTCIGALYAKRLRLRCLELTNLIKAVDIIESEISFNARNVAQILKNLKSSHISKSCKLIKLCNGTNGEEFAQSIAQNAKALPLEIEDIKSIISFFELLGKTDVETEISRCKMAKSTLKMHLDDAAQIAKNKTKLCYTLGLFAGLTVSALII